MSVGLFERWMRGTVRTEERADWLALVGPEFADQVLRSPLTDRYHAKQGRVTGRWVLSTGEKRLVVYVKRHHRESWWRRLAALLWPQRGWSAAQVEWRNLQWAEAQGIRVPPPLAVGEFIGPGLRLESFLVIEELTGYLPLHEAIPDAAKRLAPDRFEKWKRRLVTSTADACRHLHALGHFHKDLYLCHFFVRPAAEGSEDVGPVYLIDLHRMRRHRLTAWYCRIKDLAQLLYSTDVPGVTDRDRLRFFRAYVGRGRARWWDRLLLWFVLLKASRYRRHNQRREPLLTPKGKDNNVRVSRA